MSLYLSMDGLSEELRAFGSITWKMERISDNLDEESLGFPKGMEMDLILNIERYHVLSDGTYAMSSATGEF